MGNIVTGIFVENATSLSAKDEELMLLAEAEKRKVWMDEVKRLFSLTALDRTRDMTFEEFTRTLKNAQVQMCLKNLGIDVFASSHHNLFEMFDFDGTGEIAIDELATGLMKIQGNARSIDLAEVRHK